MTTHALYRIPEKAGGQATYVGPTFTSAKKARAARKASCDAGIEVGIHSGEKHPHTLPLGSRLYCEPGSRRLTAPLSQYSIQQRNAEKTMSKLHEELLAKGYVHDGMDGYSAPEGAE